MWIMQRFEDATIDRMSVSTQYGNYISIEGVKFGITDRIYLDGDITKKDGEKEHINAQYAIRADGVYVYSIGQDQVSSSHKIRIVTGNDVPEKMVPFDRLSLSHRKMEIRLLKSYLRKSRKNMLWPCMIIRKQFLPLKKL